MTEPLTISTDPARLDIDLIHAFLSEQAYWAIGRPRALTERAIAHSLCFGAYDAEGAQLAFARVVTDRALFAYLADVFVVPEGRGRGVGKALVAAIMEHEDVRSLRRVVLATDDAHGLYAPFGFTPLSDAEKWMGIRRGPV
ncbi:GNAT family N-acetyltransferase [Paraconexibacter sp. AEG42_29]|uniref:GNAT family N-acetyltransferase n=1 Tax=Paraconexibacter sp. AEG42_29 TaxID=2997339 RepID=UPI00339DA3F6